VFESSVGSENSHSGDPDDFFENSNKIGEIQSKCSGDARGNGKFQKPEIQPRRLNYYPNTHHESHT
jgi:hypothetical protein